MFASALIAATIAAATPGTPSGPTVFDGEFQLSYQPVYCVNAPCPSGTYSAVAGNKVVVSFKSFVLDGKTRGEQKIEGLRSFEGDGLAIDGALSVQDGVATITSRRVIPGLWKIEGELPAGDGDSTTGATAITIVNQTGDVIRGIYFSPARDDHWGPDRTNENLRIKQNMTLDLPAGDCVYDIRIILGGRPSEELKRQDLCKDSRVVADRSGTIVERR